MAKQLQPEWTFKWEAFEETRDFPLTVKMVRDVKATAPPHSHDFFELLLVVAGTGSYETSSGEYQLKQGDIFLLHPGHVHGFSNQHHLVVYNILWKAEELCFDFREIGSFQHHGEGPVIISFFISNRIPVKAITSNGTSIWIRDSLHSCRLLSNGFTTKSDHAEAVTNCWRVPFSQSFSS